MLLLSALVGCGVTPAPSDPAAPAPEVAEPPAAPPAPEPEPEPSMAAYGLRGVDYACAVCGSLLGMPGVDVEATASSSLDPTKYGAGNVLGVDLSTAWCEGAKDAPGVGEKLKIAFGRPLHLEAVGLYGGFFKSSALLEQNGRVKEARIRTDGGIDEVVRLEDPAIAKQTDPSTGQPVEDWWVNLTQGEPPWHSVKGGAEGNTSSWLEIEILSVYPGSKYTDTCISRVDVMVVDPEELE